MITFAQKSKYELFVKLLKQLNNAGILKNFVLVGDWCLPFYKDYFADGGFSPDFEDKNIEILIPMPAAIRTKIDLLQMLKDISFEKDAVSDFVFIHNKTKLTILFLISEKCKDFDKPAPLSKLNIYAKPQRFLDVLIRNTIESKIESFTITIPHPVNYVIHKLFTIQTKTLQTEKLMEKESALQILNALINKNEHKVIKTTLNSLPCGWRTEIKKHLSDSSRDIVNLFW